MFAAMSLDPDTAASLTLKVIDLAAAGDDVDVPAVPIVAVGTAAEIAASDSQWWLQHATFTLTEDDVDDRRVVTVPSTRAAIAEIQQRVERWPQAAAICDDVLRATDPSAPTWSGLVTESLAYSTLQTGREFRDWLARRGPASAPSHVDTGSR